MYLLVPGCSPGSQTAFVVTSPRSPLGCDSFSISLFFMTLTVLGSTGQAFCRTLLSLDLSSVFFHGYTEVVDLGKNTRFLSRRGKMPLLIHCCQGAHDASMTSWVRLTFITRVRWCLPGFFTLKLVFFCLAILFFGSKSPSGPPSRTVSTCV